MPLEVQIIRASEFIRLDAHGQLDLAISREILKQLASACRRRGINQALLDLRDVHPGPQPMLTRHDLAVLVNTFREVGFSDKQRLAVLYSADPHHRARLFAFMTTLRGWNVKASEKFEEALHWLSQGESEKGGKGAGEQEVPLHFARTADDLPAGMRQATSTAKETRAPASRRPLAAVSNRPLEKRRPKARRSCPG